MTDTPDHPHDFDMPLGDAMRTQRAIRRLTTVDQYGNRGRRDDTGDGGG